MKKTLLSITMLVAGIFSASAQYCAPSYTYDCSSADYINNFSTTLGSTNISNLGSGCSGLPNNYSYHTATQVTILPGGTFDFAVQAGSSWSQGHRIWIDWNNDLDFSDPGEDIWNSGTYSTAVYTGSITAPPGAVGTFRMRVRCAYYTVPADPCLTESFGEVEDYNIVVLAPYANDAGIAAIEAPSLPTCAIGSGNIMVELANSGTDTLMSCNINYSINAGTPVTYPWTGSLAPYSTMTGVNLGAAVINNGDDLLVWTDSPNGVADSLSSNDSIMMTVQTGLAGTYIIDPSGAGDYLTFNDAVNAINTYGLCDDVSFQAVDGIYNEQITLTEVMNANDTNTVTFESYSGNPMACVLTYSGTTTGDNQVINMDGGDHYIFKNLTLFNPGVTYGTVIRVGNGAHMNRWEGNIIASDSLTGSTTSTNKCVIYSASNTIDSMNVFDGNDILFGSYGMYWYGGNTTTFEYGTKILNNNFRGQYYRPINSQYQQNIEIAGNTLTPGPNYTGSIYRIYLYYNQGASMIHGNRIETNKYGYGIYMSQCSGNLAERGWIYNNFIHVGDSATTSTSYGIYLTGTNYQVITHNSINMTSNGTSTRGLYVTGSGNIVVRNNAIMNDGPGYGIYHFSGITECDYNNVYVPNGNLYYQSGNIDDLAVWQSMTGFGMNSDTLDPMFMGADNLHTCANQLDGAAMVDTMVMYDIDGDMRDTNSPDIGADEFLVPGNLTFADDTIWKCTNDMVTLGGWEPTTAGNYQWSTLETTPTIDVLAPGNYFVNITSACGNGSPSVNVSNIPDAVADFTVGSSFMTLITTNNSSGTITDYLWDFGDGSTSTDFEPLHLYADTGYYVVTLTVTGPCGTDTYVDTMYSNTVGLDEVSIDNALSVYPNPNTGEFTIDLNLDQAANVSAVVTDLQGKAVWTSAMGTVNGAYSEKVDLTGNASGVYILKITVDGESANRKIIVE